FCNKCNGLVYDGYSEKGVVRRAAATSRRGSTLYCHLIRRPSRTRRRTGASAINVTSCFTTDTPKKGVVRRAAATSRKASISFFRTPVPPVNPSVNPVVPKEQFRRLNLNIALTVATSVQGMA